MSPMIIGFAVALVVIAVLTKVVGCGAGAKLCKCMMRKWERNALDT